MRTRSIGPVGTVARLCLGIALVLLGVSEGALWPLAIEWQTPVVGLVALPVSTLLGQWLRLRFTDEPLNATGPVGFGVNFAVGLVLFTVDFTRDGAMLFAGLSLFLAAARGYAGCEVLAISNWLLRRDDQVGCVVFSPLDAAEATLTVVSPRAGPNR